MSVVPLVCPFVAIGVLLYSEELGAHKVLELLDLHSSCAQLRDVKRRRLIIVVGKTMRGVVLAALETQVLRILIHLLKEVKHLRVVSELGRLYQERTLLDIEGLSLFRQLFR